MLGIKKRTWTWSLTFNESLEFKSLGCRGIHDIESRQHETKPETPLWRGFGGTFCGFPKVAVQHNQGYPILGKPNIWLAFGSVSATVTSYCFIQRLRLLGNTVAGHQSRRNHPQ
jgi:hypothetical protein